MYIDKIYSELIAKMIDRLSVTKLEEYQEYKEWADRHYNIITELVEFRNSGKIQFFKMQYFFI